MYSRSKIDVSSYELSIDEDFAFLLAQPPFDGASIAFRKNYHWIFFVIRNNPIVPFLV